MPKQKIDPKLIKPTAADIDFARDLIAREQKSITYSLSEAYKGDLLADNRNDWSLDFINKVLAAIGLPDPQTLEGGEAAI